MTRTTVRLAPAERDAALDASWPRPSYEVLVVGGGVVGAGVSARRCDPRAVRRPGRGQGLRPGTSSRSSKLIHGGLRYLEQLNVGLVREALRASALLLQRLAPHLVRPVSFLFPFTHYGWERAYVGTGVSAYDVLGFAWGRPGLPRPPAAHPRGRAASSRPRSGGRR